MKWMPKMTISKNKGLTSFYLSHPTSVPMVLILNEEHVIGQALPLHILDFCFKLHMLLLSYLIPAIYPCRALNGVEIILLATVILIAAFRWLYVRRNSTPLPPGPKGLPFIGNALQIPHSFQYLKFQEWVKQYGA